MKTRIPKFRKKMPSPFKHPEKWDRYMTEWTEHMLDLMCLATATRLQKEKKDRGKR